MTTPIVRQAMTAANADVLVAEIPNEVAFATVTIVLSNTSDSGDATCRISIGKGNSVESKFTMDAKSVLTPGGGQTFSCIVCEPGEKIWIRSNTSAVAVNIRGMMD